MSANRPRIVCICGSTRFRGQMAAANRDLTLAGAIVVAPGVFQHQGDQISDDQKMSLVDLHFAKIRMADEVLVVAPGDYIGAFTRREVEYARTLGKPVRFMEPEGKRPVTPGLADAR